MTKWHDASGCEFEYIIVCQDDGFTIYVFQNFSDSWGLGMTDTKDTENIQSMLEDYVLWEFDPDEISNEEKEYLVNILEDVTKRDGKITTGLRLVETHTRMIIGEYENFVVGDTIRCGIGKKKTIKEWISDERPNKWKELESYRCRYDVDIESGLVEITEYGLESFLVDDIGNELLSSYLCLAKTDVEDVEKAISSYKSDLKLGRYVVSNYLPTTQEEKTWTIWKVVADVCGGKCININIHTYVDDWRDIHGCDITKEINRYLCDIRLGHDTWGELLQAIKRRCMKEI